MTTNITGYRLTCRYDENSDFDDPRIVVSLMPPNTCEPVQTHNVPLSRLALDKAMAFAQKWMMENVYHTDCRTLREAKARELDTSEVDELIRINFPRPVQDKAISMVRLLEAAKARGMKPRTQIVMEESDNGL